MKFQCKGILTFTYLGKGACLPAELLPAMVLQISAQICVLALRERCTGWAGGDVV